MTNGAPGSRISPGGIRIAVFGMGHVGLPTALGLAELGWDVIGVETEPSKVALLAAGQCPFYEPGLQQLLRKHGPSARFRVSADVEGAVRSASVLFICVGTPQRENGEPDLTQVEEFSRVVARNLNGYKLIVEKSTVPAMTSQRIKTTIERYARIGTDMTPVFSEEGPKGQERKEIDRSAIEYDVASNPEFLREGKALQNFFAPDRIVLGVESERAAEILREIYRPLNCPILLTNLSTAELIKHAANAFLAAKISFINVVADLCEAVGADVTKVARAIGLDPRIGGDFLGAGVGFGGYCLPKDLQGFIHLGEEHGVDCSLLKEIERINQRRVALFLKKVRQALWVLQGKTIGLLGLAFKAGTDDIREAPSLKIIEALLKEGAVLQLYDPQAMPNTRRVFSEQPGRLIYCLSPYEAAREAHALLLLTEWDEFQKLDFTRLRDLMAVPVLIDGRNFYDPVQVRLAGFEYLCMGRRSDSNLSGYSGLSLLRRPQLTQHSKRKGLVGSVCEGAILSNRRRF